MNDDLDPSHNEPVDNRPPSNRRILAIMAIVGVLGAIVGGFYVSASFALGVLIGTVFAFVNYFWLQKSLKTIFDSAKSGEKPRLAVGKYFLRHIVLGVAVAVIYIAGWVPIVALILGMAGFGFATVIEGFIRIFSGIFSDKEI